jgi:hypothetical protein
LLVFIIEQSRTRMMEHFAWTSSGQPFKAVLRKILIIPSPRWFASRTPKVSAEERLYPYLGLTRLVKYAEDGRFPSIVTVLDCSTLPML